MSKTLEEIALQVAKEVKGQQGDLNIQIVEFSRRLVAALGAQEPVGHYCVSYFRGCAGMANTEFQPSIDFAEGTHALYAAPYIKEGWQTVPKEPDLNMVIAGESCIGRHAYAKMLAAAPEYKP